MGKIYIVTDSATDFSLDYAEKLGVHVVPLMVAYGDKTYRDRYDINTRDLLNMLKSDILPKTSQVTPHAFYEAYKAILEDKESEIISIHLSSGLSGTYNSALIAKEMIGSNRIHVIDSKSVSFGTGLLILEMIKMIDANMDVKDIVNEIEIIRGKLKVAFFVDTMEYLKKGGRISPIKANIGSLLNIKPILYLKDGIIDVLDKPRGRKRAYNSLLKYIGEEEIDLNRSFALGNVDSKEYTDEFIECLGSKFNIKDILIVDAGAAIAVYSGPGTVGVYFFTK